jgi:hypothetical protein
VSQTVNQVELIAGAIAATLGPLPPATSDRPIHDNTSTQANATLGLTPKQQLYKQFWAEFKPIAERHGWTKATAPALNWWNMPGGVTGTTWATSFSKFGARVELYFEHVDPATNLARWRVLYERRHEIIARFGGNLIFDELPKNKGCRIETRLFDVIIDDKEQWPRVRQWMEDAQIRLRSAVNAVGGVPSLMAPTS